MKQPIISVIVPIYNVEKYLRQCVDSILAQTFTDFELLLIDDGSPDGSPAICDEYERLDSRVRVFHKPNGGVGSARNVGIENAKGKWIAFIDADDWLDHKYLENFKINEIDKPVDFIIMNGFERFGTPQFLCEKGDFYYDDSNMEEFYSRVVYGGGTFLSPWCRLFRMDIIERLKLRFAETFSYCEDCSFNFLYFREVKLIYVAEDSSYHYRDNEFSITHNRRAYHHYTRCLDVHLDDYRYFLLGKYPHNKQLENYFVSFHIIGDSLAILNDLYRGSYPYDERLEVTKKVRTYLESSEGSYKKYVKFASIQSLKIFMVMKFPFWFSDLCQQFYFRVKGYKK